MGARNYDGEIAALIFERDSNKVSGTLEGKLAILLHDHCCGYNHTDGCGWRYEIRNGCHQWDGASHEPWLVIAQKAIRESESLNNYTKSKGAGE